MALPAETLTYLRDEQPILLGADFSRGRLVGVTDHQPRSSTVRIAVNRSLPFEYIAPLSDRIAASWSAGLRFDYSDYDPGLATLVDHDSDVVMFWIDWRFQQSSLTPAGAVQWVLGRIAAVRSRFDGPIAVNNWPELLAAEENLLSASAGQRHWVREFNLALENAIAGTAGVHVLDLAALAGRIGAAFFDARNDRLSSYPFSGRASAAIAQHVGGPFVHALIHPRLKAVVVDLDNTLYDGVLGEDGEQSLRIDEGHHDLAAGLLTLRRSGILLALCSKNDRAPVEELLRTRGAVLGLALTDFDAVEVNWRPKADNIAAIASAFNIDPSAMVFIDDNPAELAQVASALPAIRLIHASSGAATWAQLSRFPGLYQLEPDRSAAARQADIAAQDQRQSLRATAATEADYLAALDMRVELSVNRVADAQRLSEMSQKFNQFNLAQQRFSAAESERLFTADYVTLTVRVRDLFADSGLVGALVFALGDGHAQLCEALFSCRVLGRGLENLALADALTELRARGITTLDICVVDGDRNGPARDWLAGLTPTPAGVDVAELARAVEARIRHYPALVESS